jgi:hypothetical protein
MLQEVPRMLARHLQVSAGLEAGQGHGGTVTPVQSFGSAANLLIHLHGLVVDRASPYGADGVPVPVEGDAPIDDELQALLRAVITRLLKMLTPRDGAPMA